MKKDPIALLSRLAPVIVVAVGGVVLLPCLGSYGLWEPPDSWPTFYRRGENRKPLNEKLKQLRRPRSEIRIADEARREVEGPKRAGQAKAGTKGRKKKPVVGELAPRPPLTRFLISSGFRLFGVSEWSARLPLALTGLLGLLLTFVFLRRFFDVWTGVAGAAVLLGLPGFVLQSRQLTSDIVTITCLTAAVGGLGLWVAPVRRRPVWALGIGLLGLVGGFYARGAVIGVLLPLLTIGVTMTMARGLYWRDPSGGPSPLRFRFLLEAGGALVVVVILALVGAWLLGTHDARYSAFFGETPLAVTRIMNFHGIKPPTWERAVFDVQLKQIAYAAFPWVALLPAAVAALLMGRRIRGQAPGAPALDDDRVRLDRFGRLLIVSWAGVAFLVSTYWVLRYGDLAYPALPALAAAVGVLLCDLAREAPGRLRLAAALLLVAILAIVLRDLGSAPEALVSNHIHYQLQYPAEVSIKWPLRLTVFAVGLLAVGLLLGPGARAPVRWWRTLSEWFASARLGADRFFGLPGGESDPGEPEGRRPALWPLVALVLLGVAAASLVWNIQAPRPSIGAVILTGVLVPYVALLLPYLLVCLAVDPLLFMVDLVWRLMSGLLFEDMRFFPEGERGMVRSYLRKQYLDYLDEPLGRQILNILQGPAIILLLFGYVLRLALRVVVLLLVLVGLCPIVAYEILRRVKGSPSWPRPALVAVAALPAVGILFTSYVGFALTKRLSYHFSYKEIIDTYNRSRNAKRREPLALYKVHSRSPVYYTQGPLIAQHQLIKRYPARGGQSTLLQYLEQGWRDKQGRFINRVYAIIPVGELGKLDRDAHSREPRVDYYVLDARNSFYLLVSNRLGKIRRNGRLVAEKDQNPLRQLVLDRPPSIRCRRGENAQCRHLRVTFSERKGSEKVVLELIGAKFPKVITAGRKFEIILYFKVINRIAGRYKVFIHVDGRGNRILGDHDPVKGQYDTSMWLPGRWVVDPFTVPSSNSSAVSTPPGIYTVMVGLFQGDRRMQVLQGPHRGDNRVILGRVRVAHPLAFGCGR